MAKQVLRIPFVGLVAKLALFCAGVAILVVGVISYLSYASLDESVAQMRQVNTDSRVELAKCEGRVEAARDRVEKVLESEAKLREETEELKREALQLERQWEEVKKYRQRMEESGREIEEIRRRIRDLGR
jgi:predicted RNase H-like nuclease (RuvC/YqgF family)